jgi:uncharacterized protein
MTKDLLRYDLMVQDALKGVVRRVLVDAAREGLPGDHHFYISFRTDFPGVRLSQRMREKYPDEMTVVLQHQFWDLLITEHTFEVGLSFSGIPERLLIPFDSIVGFFDPSVQFGLKFELNADAPPVAEADPAQVTTIGTKTSARAALRSVSSDAPETDAKPDQIKSVLAVDAPAPAAKPAAKASPKPRAKDDKAAQDIDAKPEDKSEDKPGAKSEARALKHSDTSSDAKPDASAQVVRLDAFRKKP